MLKVEKRAEIRQAYFNEGKSIRQIARDLECCRKTVRKAIQTAEPEAYTLKKPREAPVLGPYKERIAELLAENERLPRKQRYTAKRIYEVICEEGYVGSESGVRRYVGLRRRETKKRKVYLQLEFDPGMDAQVDWGEGVVIMDGEETKAQLFYMRLCYSRKLFMMAFPRQNQESFLLGHVAAFHHFGGVPHRIAYDNLKAAVYRVLEGKNRQEQERFIVFRSHYLYEARYCTVGAGHEKGGVEHAVGFGRRNYLVPLPEVGSFEELNALLLARCQADDARKVARQPHTIGEAWETERPLLRSLPERDQECCVTRPAKLNAYSQVTFQTNRYSVPADKSYPNLVVRAFPFRVQILHMDEMLAEHARCYDRERDIIDPLHYLPLLVQRPGAFEHAKPLRQWRSEWPPAYDVLLERIQAQDEENAAIREFVAILNLHREHPAEQVERAVEMALEHGCPHFDGVKLCLRHLTEPAHSVGSLDLSENARLNGVGATPPDLSRYDRLLGGHDGN
jgi:transposase